MKEASSLTNGPEIVSIGRREDIAMCAEVGRVASLKPNQNKLRLTMPSLLD